MRLSFPKDAVINFQLARNVAFDTADKHFGVAAGELRKLTVDRKQAALCVAHADGSRDIGKQSLQQRLAFPGLVSAARAAGQVVQVNRQKVTVSSCAELDPPPGVAGVAGGYIDPAIHVAHRASGHQTAQR